jgi:hypothetical protein
MPTITSIRGVFTQQLSATLTRISTTPGGGQANGASGLWDQQSAQVFTGDGRRIVYETNATDIVGGDANGNARDAIAQDLFGGARSRVSLNGAGAQQAANSLESATLSADGRYVFFASSAPDFVAGDTNGAVDVFRRDLATGAVVRVTTDAAGAQTTGMDGTSFSTSADGRYVVFASAATTLVAGDTNATFDVFRKDLTTGAVERVSTQIGGAQATGGDSTRGSISADGRYVVFQSAATDLVAGDTNGVIDIFVKDMATGFTFRVSTAGGGLQATGGGSGEARISADGRYVVFESAATNLVAGDTNGLADIFRKDLQTGAIVRVNTDSGGAQATGGASSKARISADGRFVVFRSDATNLVAGDTNAAQDGFVKDLQTGAITRVTFNPDTATQGGAGTVFDIAISADGRFVAVDTSKDNLVAGDTGFEDMFIYDTQRAAINAGVANGGKVVSLAVGTRGGDLLDVYWGDGSNSVNRAVTSRADATLSTLDHAYAQDGRYTITLASTNPGVPAAALGTATAIIATDFAGFRNLSPGFNGPVNGFTTPVGISANGQHVAIASSATNLIPGVGNFSTQLYVRDALTGDLALASANAAGVVGNNSIISNDPAFVSDDGLRVVFTANASNLVAGDANGANDVFLKNLQTGAVTLLSSTQGGTPGNGFATLGDASPDLTWAAFVSGASNLGNGTGGNDTNGLQDAFLKNTVTGAIQNVSLSTAGVQANSSTGAVRVSDNGRFVAFETFASNLDAADTNSATDVFLRDTQTNTTTRISLGAGNAQIAGTSFLADLSGDGTQVLFWTSANLVAADTNGVGDFYARNIATGALTLVSARADGTTSGTGNVSTMTGVRFSADNRYVTFKASNAYDPADTNFAEDVFRKDLVTGALTRISSIDGVRGGSSGILSGVASADAQTIAIGTSSNDLVGFNTFGTTNTLLWQAGGAAEQLVSGTTGADIVQASAWGDQIATFGGDDTIFAKGGADTVDGGAGNDVIYGGAGDDSLLGNDNSDTIYGEAGNDVFNDTFGANTMEGGEGNDYFYIGGSASGSVNRIVGQGGFDSVQFNEAIFLDWSTNTFGGNILNAGLLRDDVEGWVLSNDADRLHLHTTTSASLIYGNGGNDTLDGGIGADTLYGGADNDTLNGQDGSDTLIGDAGNDQFFDSFGNNRMEGGDGDDYFFVSGTASGSVNRIIGGAGFDAVQFFEAMALDFATGALGGNAQNANIQQNDVEGWVLSNGADRLNLHNTLANSVVFGNGGNDTLSGGLGQDTLNGGGGADSFLFQLLPGTTDVIQDFTGGQDRITVQRAWLGQPAGAETNIPLVNFVSGASPAPTFATPQILYDTTTGLLSFDPDGTGGTAAIPLANLGAGTALSASDVFMV